MAPPNGRPDVNLRTGGALPGVVSRPIAIGTPGIGTAMGTGKASDLVNKVGAAGANLQRNAPQDGNAPPAPPPVAAKDAAKAVPPTDAQALIREIEAANANGGVAAVLKALSDFDQRVGIPGLGREIIELHSSPPATPKKN